MGATADSTGDGRQVETLRWHAQTRDWQDARLETVECAASDDAYPTGTPPCGDAKALLRFSSDGHYCTTRNCNDRRVEGRKWRMTT